MNEIKGKIMDVITKSHYDGSYAVAVVNATTVEQLQEIAKEIISEATEKASIHGLTRRGSDLVVFFRMSALFPEPQPQQKVSLSFARSYGMKVFG